MSDRPILFSAPMVRALLAGTKTQTRRIVAGVPERPFANCHPHNIPRHPTPYLDSYCSERKTPANPRGMSTEWCWWQVDDRPGLLFKVKHKPGDRLWVREAWRVTRGFDEIAPRDLDRAIIPEWLATDPPLYQGRIRASLHLPRWASRLTLTATDVRVQRLQDISEEDARAEGAFIGKASGRVADNQMAMNLGLWHATARGWYADLWDRINGAGAWARNDWVAAYTFTVERRNVDARSMGENHE